MKKTITLILAIFLINCNKNDSVFEEVLSEVEVTTAKGINYEKLSGKWNFSSSSTSAKSMASCSINWIEFISNTDGTPNNSSGKFIMKLDVSDGASEYVQGWYHIRYDLTANDVPIDRVTLFDTQIENGSTSDGPENGNIATFTNIQFDAQGGGISFSFLPESRISAFCSSDPVVMSGEKSQVWGEEQNVTQGVKNNLESIQGSWIFYDLDSTFSNAVYPEGSPVAVAEGYTHFCYWLDDKTREFCSNGTDAYGLPIVDASCSLLSPNLNPIRLAKVTITKSGSYFLSYYDVSGVRVSLIDGSWRPWGEPNSNGNYSRIEVTKLIPAPGEGSGPASSIWEESELFNIVGFNDDTFQNGTEMKLSSGWTEYSIEYLNTFTLISEGAEYSLYQCPQIVIEEAAADTTAPVITLIGSTVIELTVGDTFTDQGATATDNVDGDLTSSITSTSTVNTSVVGFYYVLYSVTDAAGNPAAPEYREINVRAADTTAPVITLIGSTVIELTVGDTFTDQGATATDNVDGDLTSSITSTSTVNTSVVGFYYVLYSVTDAAGNPAAPEYREINVRAAATTYSILVTASSNSDYTLSGTDVNGTVSGDDVSITINNGDTLSFDVNAPNHPFYIKTVQGTGTDNQVSSVTNNGTIGGVVNWTPTVAGIYYYQCSVHDGMYGTITVQ